MAEAKDRLPHGHAARAVGSPALPVFGASRTVRSLSVVEDIARKSPVIIEITTSIGVEDPWSVNSKPDREMADHLPDLVHDRKARSV